MRQVALKLSVTLPGRTCNKLSSQHQRLVHDLFDLFLVCLDSNNTVSSETPSSIGEDSDGLQEILDHDWLEDVELELTI